MQTFLHVCGTQQRCVSRESQGTLIIFFYCFRLSLVYSVPAAHSPLSLCSCVCQLCCHYSALGSQPNLAACITCPVPACSAATLCCLHEWRRVACGLRVLMFFSMWCYLCSMHTVQHVSWAHHHSSVIYNTLLRKQETRNVCFLYLLTFVLKGHVHKLLRSLWNEWWLFSST